MYKLIILLAFILFCNLNTKAEDIKDFFNVPKLNFDNQNYNLAWSANPTSSYYKQEYLRDSEKVESYQQMILLEDFNTDFSVEFMVKMKAEELEERKTYDKICNYQIIENPTNGEFMLDFVLSLQTDEKAIVEWNIYRYVKRQDTSGKAHIVLYAFSKRAYNDDIVPFIKDLKDSRYNFINKVGTLEIPILNIKGK